MANTISRGIQSASRPASAETLARGLGWFSIALGLAEVLAPRALARATAVPVSEQLLAGYGVREIATGIGILSAKSPTPWVWGRVGGDALDLATLAGGLGNSRRRNRKLRVALAAVAGVTALDMMCAMSLNNQRQRSGPPRDYTDRRGMPRPAEAMRGAARDFRAPRDMRIPEALRPYAAS
ncbi:MAG: cyclase dehydrase [Acetobacteraceae bacterium]|nr:cyclase dehydrase [Acetobacteraceae bacterium]